MAVTTDLCAKATHLWRPAAQFTYSSLRVLGLIPRLPNFPVFAWLKILGTQIHFLHFLLGRFSSRWHMLP